MFTSSSKGAWVIEYGWGINVDANIVWPSKFFWYKRQSKQKQAKIKGQEAMMYMSKRFRLLTMHWTCLGTKENDKIDQIHVINLAEALKNVISCNELLHTRCPQKDSKNRVQSRFCLWLLSKNFGCKDIKILGLSSNQITDAL